MRILVTGKNGQLGKSILKIVNSEVKTNNSLNSHSFIFVGREDLDLSNENNIARYFENNVFDTIINCAAYTAVDKAEEELDLANQINHLAVKQLAQIAKNQQAKLIHISTDYVFDGRKSEGFYKETDKVGPINFYGKTKLLGERIIRKTMSINAIIIRTGWMYSEYGDNFIKIMLRLAKTQKEINVVNDQIGSPTYASDVAQVILEIVNDKNYLNMDQSTEIYHYSNEGEVSWCDLAKEIFRISNTGCKVNPIATEQYVTSAKRPKYTPMNLNKIKKKYGIIPFSWRESLRKCIQNLIKDQ